MKLPRRIKWRHIQRLYEALAPVLKASPVKASQPDRGRVLVCSPHIDDDVIGAGGSIRKHIEAGDSVRVIYFAGCTDERIKEAGTAAGIIGLDKLEFLQYESKTLSAHPEIADRLYATLADYRPDIVYLPSLFDRHNDHLAVNSFMATIFSSRRLDITVYAYEVWTALVPNLVIDISDTIRFKKEAISAYKSQLAANDWIDAALSLNRYRGITSGGGSYAEGFMRYSMSEYFNLWKKVYGT